MYHRGLPSALCQSVVPTGFMVGGARVGTVRSIPTPAPPPPPTPRVRAKYLVTGNFKFDKFDAELRASTLWL